MSRDISDAEGWFGLVAIVVGLIVAGVLGVRSCRIERDCLSAGYPTHRASLLKGDYCVKRVDQTDVVVPYDQRNKPAATP